MFKKAFIVAEIGTIHGGNMGIAQRLIKDAKDAGADAVKLQLWSNSFVSPSDSLFNFFEQHKLSFPDFIRLYSYANNLGIYLFASVFDKESADLLEKLGTKHWKIASRTVKDDPELTKYILEKRGVKFISLGMVDDYQLPVGVEVPDYIYFLHCVSKYPVPDNEANLERIQDLVLKLGTTNIGYSDHTEGIDACIFARAMGALVIEKHIRADFSSKKHPDYDCAITPVSFKIMVDKIRKFENML